MKMRDKPLRTPVIAGILVLILTGALALYAQDGKAKGRPKVEVTPARRSPGGVVPLPRAPLLRENSRLVDVEGVILDMKTDLKVSPVHRAVFQPRDGLGYFILLENSVLEKTLTETGHGERPVKVRGTVMLCQGRNYLLLDWAAVRRE